MRGSDFEISRMLVDAFGPDLPTGVKIYAIDLDDESTAEALLSELQNRVGSRGHSLEASDYAGTYTIHILDEEGNRINGSSGRTPSRAIAALLTVVVKRDNQRDSTGTDPGLRPVVLDEQETTPPREWRAPVATRG